MDLENAPLVLYIHGFNSSPQSWKARALGEYISAYGVAIDYRVPDLPWEPERAAALLADTIRPLLPRRPLLVGSSLGGYYATWLAENHDLRAVLINPAVRPYELLLDYLGDNANLYTEEHYELRPEHVEQLRALEVEVTRPANFMYMVQTGDETLDYNQAVAKYAASRGIIEAGGSHGFDHFERWIPAMLNFFRVPVPVKSS